MRKYLYIFFLACFLTLVSLEVALRILALGYNRLHEVSFEKNADYKILCVGESSTWGVGSSDPLKKNYPHQLENLLSQKFPETSIECFFDQTIGQNTSEVLRKLPAYVLKYQPNLIILMVGVNNWWNLNKSNVLLFTKKNFIANTVFQLKIFLDQFRVWKLFKWLVYSLDPSLERWNYWFPEGKMNDVGDYEMEIADRYNMEMIYKVTEHDINQMVKFCKAKRIPVILASYPGEYLDLENVTIVQRKIAAENNIPLVDNALLFKNLSDPVKYFSADGWHPNDAGYTLTAENVYNVIVENKFIDGKPAVLHNE